MSRDKPKSYKDYLKETVKTDKNYFSFKKFANNQSKEMPPIGTHSKKVNQKGFITTKIALLMIISSLLMNIQSIDITQKNIIKNQIDTMISQEVALQETTGSSTKQEKKETVQVDDIAVIGDNENVIVLTPREKARQEKVDSCTKGLELHEKGQLEWNDPTVGPDCKKFIKLTKEEQVKFNEDFTKLKGYNYY